MQYSDKESWFIIEPYNTACGKVFCEVVRKLAEPGHTISFNTFFSDPAHLISFDLEPDPRLNKYYPSGTAVKRVVDEGFLRQITNQSINSWREAGLEDPSLYVGSKEYIGVITHENQIATCLDPKWLSDIGLLYEYMPVIAP